MMQNPMRPARWRRLWPGAWRGVLAVGAAVACVGMQGAWPARAAAQEAPPPGVQQLLPRNAIPAIFEPQFVSAEQADIPDDAFVLGVVVGGEARAYSLNLLNHHEIVNDRLGGRPIAAVW